MDADAVDDQYFTYEGRLASFQKSKKRGSTAKGSKALNWPHKKIAPERLAQAGFFFQPWAENPDNVVCFLCQKSMDGWEEGDDPVREHLKHSPTCGWIVTAAVEAEIDGYAQIHPAEASMVEARKATFAGKWPHDGKRGWKCKTKQLVDAGWKYTPTTESDDNATCAYCSLGLDGWEPSDKPYDEHFKRSPRCPFFELSKQPKPRKKTTRAKNSRESKASRLSTQSVATFTSEAPSIADTTAAQDDTVLTTASTMTQGGKKTRAKKATTTKGKKTKAKKEEPEPVEQEEAREEEDHEKSPVAPPPKRATRGKKRGSDAVDESAMTVASEAPARKKRATKTRGAAAAESSVVEPQDEEMEDAPEPKKATGRKKGRVASTTQNTRKASGKANASMANTSMASVASLQDVPIEFPSDDEIERQLEADLERPLTDDEDITADSDSERRKAKAKATTKVAQQKKTTDYAMFDPAPVEHVEEEVEDEFEALRADMEVEEPQQAPQELESEPEHEPEPETLNVPKKGRKPAVRKASKQSKPKKVQAAPEPPQVEEPEEELPEPVVEEMPDEQEASVGSTDTVVKNYEPDRPSTPKAGRKQPSKASRVSEAPTEADELADEPVQLVEPPKKRGRGRPSKASVDSMESISLVDKPAEAPTKRGRGRPSKASQEGATAPAKAADTAPKRGRGRPKKVSEERVSAASKTSEAEAQAQLQEEAEAAELRVEDSLATEQEEPEILDEASGLSAVQESPELPERQVSQAPSTPGYGVSPSASARQAALSPSQSPQSSDAENQPPSSRPSATVTTKRIALAPVAETPTRLSPSKLSPSKRNVLAGLQTKTPWRNVDLETVLGTPVSGADKENATERLLKKGSELTSPEKQMTVEEWIYYNAGQAEKLLKQECEAMVNRFESEGTRAMNVLEGLEAQ